MRKKLTEEEKKARKKAWYEANKEKVATQEKLWYRKNKTKKIISKNKWKKANKEKVAAQEKAWRKANLDKVIAKNAKYRAAKLKATPDWLTEKQHKKMVTFYSEAKRLEKLDSISRHVDHIVPLQGENISGLHVPWNLRVVTAGENMSKSNKILDENVLIC